MSGQGKGPRRTRSEARDEFLENAGDLWDRFNEWYDAHPEATYDEMEEEIGRQRRGVLGNFLELSLQRGDLGATAEAPDCEECGQPMEFKGYPKKKIQGLETDVQMPRAYYVCPTCKVGLFPPGAAFGTEEGRLE